MGDRKTVDEDRHRGSPPKSEGMTNLPGLVTLQRDAKFLSIDGRHHGALLLLLCVVDGLASIKYPLMTRNENKKRYCKYLRSIFAKNVWPNVPFNLIDPTGECRMEEILYTFLRNPIVHEGANLDAAADGWDGPIRIDWESKGDWMNPNEGVAVFNAQKLVAFLNEVVSRGVLESMGFQVTDEHRPDPLDTECQGAGKLYHLWAGQTVPLERRNWPFGRLRDSHTGNHKGARQWPTNSRWQP